MKKIDIITEAIYIIQPNIESILARYQKNNPAKDITTLKLIKILSKASYNLAKELDISAQTTSSLLTELFPNREKSTNKVCLYILSEVGYKLCTECMEVKELDQFRKNKYNKDGLNRHCAICHSEATARTQTGRQSKYRCSKLNRTPKWADLLSIKYFYDKCPAGYHVDHIVPLQGELVSGLHVLNNLQYLIASENCSKSNNFIVE